MVRLVRFFFIPSAGVIGHLDYLGEELRRALNESTFRCSRLSPTSSQVPTQELLSGELYQEGQYSLRPSQLSLGLPTRNAAREASSQAEKWMDVPRHLKASESSRKGHHEWTSRDGMPHAKTLQSRIDLLAEAQEATPSAGARTGSASTQSRTAIVEGSVASEIILANVKEHAPPLAGAHVETGGRVHITGDVVDRAASGGCCVSSCSPDWLLGSS